MSWHINNKGKSIISEMLSFLDDGTLLEILTKEDIFVIDKNDNVVVGNELLFISHDEETKLLINTNHIISMQIIKGVPEKL